MLMDVILVNLMPFYHSKKNFKKKIIGVTCHGSNKIVNQAIKNKVDYIAVGSFFKSGLKPKAKKANFKNN